jgi:hypothetical protein
MDYRKISPIKTYEYLPMKLFKYLNSFIGKYLFYPWDLRGFIIDKFFSFA